MKKIIVFFAVIMLIAAKSVLFADGPSDINIVPVVPEPGSLIALGTGLVGFAGYLIKRRK